MGGGGVLAHALATLVFAVLLILLAGGAIFGLPSIYPLLYERGHWAGNCDNAAACVQALSTTKCCDAQLAHITMLSSLSYFLTDASAAPWGEAVDRVGALPMLGLSTTIASAGAVVLGFGVKQRAEGMVTAAMLMLAVAGPGVFNAAYTGCLRAFSSLTASSSLRVFSTRFIAIGCPCSSAALC